MKILARFLSLRTMQTFLVVGIMFIRSLSWAAGPGASSGLTLLKNTDARSSALGGAAAAMTDDISAMVFNPSSLSTLKSGHMSLQFERGFFDDSFGKVLVGVRGPGKTALGLSAGQYDSGKTTLYDGQNARSLTAQKDILASLGAGTQFKLLDVGLSATMLKSELAEANKGSASSVDAGIQVQVIRSLRFGVSAPLFQSDLRYNQEKEDLPNIIRSGLAFSGQMPLATGEVPLLILFDAPYDRNEKETFFAIGAEALVGPLAFRAGFNNMSRVQRASVGVGFQLKRIKLDYAFGFNDGTEFDSVHKANFSFRFNDFRSNTH